MSVFCFPFCCPSPHVYNINALSLSLFLNNLLCTVCSSRPYDNVKSMDNCRKFTTQGKTTANSNGKLTKLYLSLVYAGTFSRVESIYSSIFAHNVISVAHT